VISIIALVVVVRRCVRRCVLVERPREERKAARACRVANRVVVVVVVVARDMYRLAPDCVDCVVVARGFMHAFMHAFIRSRRARS